ncbi:MAG: YihY/virulence factor BrkB family protein [Acidobacteriota bacterium]
MTTKELIGLTKESATAWMDDYAPSMGAALAYYTIFSLAPMLIIVIAVAGLVFGADAARGEIVSQLGGLLGTEGAIAVQELLKSASQPAASIGASILGLIALLLGATSVFAELQSDLDRIWRAPVAIKTNGVWNLLRSRLLSFGMVLAIGFLLLVSLVVSAALSAAGKWWAPTFVGFVWLLQAVNLLVSFGITTVLFALIYKILPRVRVAWRDVWVGATATSLLFITGKFAIGLYLGVGAIASPFGAAGSLVVMLVWVYYSTQVFLLGAEFTWVFSHRHGSRAGRVAPAAAPEVPTLTDSAPPERRRPGG